MKYSYSQFAKYLANVRGRTGNALSATSQPIPKIPSLLTFVKVTVKSPDQNKRTFRSCLTENKKDRSGFGEMERGGSKKS